MLGRLAVTSLSVLWTATTALAALPPVTVEAEAGKLSNVHFDAPHNTNFPAVENAPGFSNNKEVNMSYSLGGTKANTATYSVDPGAGTHVVSIVYENGGGHHHGTRFQDLLVNGVKVGTFTCPANSHGSWYVPADRAVASLTATFKAGPNTLAIRTPQEYGVHIDYISIK
jgi:hypothetical protein